MTTIPALKRFDEDPASLTSADLDVLAQQYGEGMRYVAAARRDAATSGPSAATTPACRMIANVAEARAFSARWHNVDVGALFGELVTKGGLSPFDARAAIQRLCDPETLINEPLAATRPKIRAVR